MPSRRLHQKTRHGCVQCKARRVKVGQALFNSDETTKSELSETVPWESAYLQPMHQM